jgi:hypothetical protein
MQRDYKTDAGKVLEAIADARRLAPADPWLDFSAGFVHQENRPASARLHAQALRSPKVAPCRAPARSTAAAWRSARWTGRRDARS